MLYGFAAERRVQEVTAVVKRLAQHGAEWGTSQFCAFASLDVLRTFDHLIVNNRLESMVALSFPPDLAYALLESHSHCIADLKFQDVEVMGVPWADV
eukprot:1122741-Pyramimonas_sp.AAC.1